MSTLQLSAITPAVASCAHRRHCQRPVNAFRNSFSRKFSCTALTRRAEAKLGRTQVRVYAEDASTTTGAGVVTDLTFEDLVLKSPVPVLVDFWAPWCGPCRMIAPLIDEIAAEYGSKIRTLKLNTDESPGVATEYGIRSIPTVMVFKGGQKMDAVIGAVPKSTLIEKVEKYLD